MATEPGVMGGGWGGGSKRAEEHLSIYSDNLSCFLPLCQAREHPSSMSTPPRLLYFCSPPLCHSISFSHPEGILSSTIGSVVNKKGTHQSEAESSGGERSKFGSNLIRNEADWWRFEEGWWSAQRQECAGRRQRGPRGGEPEICLAIRQMLYMDT